MPAASSLDPRLNGTGHRELSFLGATDVEAATAVAVRPNGKIVVAGTFTFNGGTSSDFAVARLKPNGKLDTTFGNGGSVTIDFGFAANDEQATCMAIQDDGKIVVGGWATFSGAEDFVVARLTSTGVLDTAFDVDGMRRFDFSGGGTNNDRCFGVGIQTIAGAQDRPGRFDRSNYRW